MTTLVVTVYYHPDDPRAATVFRWLQELKPRYNLQIVPVNLRDEPRLAQHIGAGLRIEVGRYRLEGDFDRRRLEITLAAAREGQDFRASILGEDAVAPQKMPLGDRILFWLSKHFLTGFLIFLGLFVTLPIAAPVFMHLGWETPARLIYKAYSLTCHQLAFRSWFLFGEQPAYPRAAAHVEGLRSFGEVTGLDEQDLWAARAYIGDERVGYKVAICQRDIALWGAFFLFTLGYWLLKRRGIRIKPLKWYWWLLAAIPIGLDGVSQLLSQIPHSPIPYRESTPLLRTLTGFLFGFATAWFMVPQMDESMDEAYRMLLKQYQSVAARRARKNEKRAA
ncbi:MAG: DUF2085 domain-containing protein [Chloroflexi bacterium]|nr:DUF2085 domain-containing protein [Chloroflexota bacterium]